MTAPTLHHDTDLLQHLGWRYATKRFTPDRPIPPEHWRTLEDAVQLSPSSYGLQPYKFLVIRDRALRQQLHPAARKQPQILDASELVVFASRTDVSAEQVDHYLARIAEVRHKSPESLGKMREAIVGDLVTGPRHAIITDWTKRQTYLALGFLLSSAAALGIDACPMEGFVPAEFDRILELPKQGLAATVLCALGYRSADDAYQHEAKVRLPREELFEYR